MRLFKKKLWARVAPPLRVFKCTKGILLVTGNLDVSGKHLITRLWLYDGEHFRPADKPSNDYYDIIYKMYPDHFEELTKDSWLYPKTNKKA